MTREEILALQPGPELDALVAEKVMGWRRMTWAESTAGSPGLSESYANDHRVTSYWHDAVTREQKAEAEECYDYYNPSEVWSPSVNIAAAWEVVEKLRERYGRVTISGEYGEWVCGHATGTDGPTIAALGTNWETSRDRRDPPAAETAPLAICRAALLAVMEG